VLEIQPGIGSQQQKDEQIGVAIWVKGGEQLMHEEGIGDTDSVQRKE
jgi:hypothetical protein